MEEGVLGFVLSSAVVKAMECGISRRQEAYIGSRELEVQQFHDALFSTSLPHNRSEYSLTTLQTPPREGYDDIH